MIVAQKLHLDVRCVLEVALEIETGAAEGAGRHLPCSLDKGNQVLPGLNDVDAHAAAACRRLYHQRVAQVPGCRLRLVIRHRIVGARQQRQSGFSCQLTGVELVAHLLHHFGPGADEGDARVLAFAGEPGVFRQETVTGVNGVRACQAGRRQNLLDIEVAVLRGRAAQGDGFIGLTYRQRTRVNLGVHGDGPDAPAAGRCG